MRRRDLFFAVAAVTVASSRAAPAQASPLRIAMLLAGQERSSPVFVAFDKRMRELGYVDGQNITILFGSAEGHPDRLPGIAAGLAAQQPKIIVAVGPEASLQAVRAATTSIPVVMVAIDYDPFARGYVASLARPGGNITGIFAQQIELAAKRLELLAQVVPAVSRVGILADAFSTDQLHAAEKVGAHLGLALETAELRDAPYDYASAIATFKDRGVGAVLTLMSPVFFRQRVTLAESLLSAGLPASFGLREWVEAGGLMSYGASIGGMMRRAAEYADKIIKGAKPSDLPIEQPVTLELVINLKTAKALGLAVPPSLLARADEVIE